MLEDTNESREMMDCVDDQVQFETNGANPSPVLPMDKISLTINCHRDIDNFGFEISAKLDSA